jgi:integrase
MITTPTSARLAHYDPEPYAESGWCGNCAACAATRRAPSDTCGCSTGHRRRRCSDPAAAFTLLVTVPRSGTAPATASCLHALGRRLAHAAYYQAPVLGMATLRNRAVLAQAVAMSSPRRRTAARTAVEAAGLTFPQALVLVISQLRQLVVSGDLSEQTADKVATHAGSLCLYMTDGLKKPVVADVRPADMHRWVASRTQNSHQPSLAVRHNRRNAARVCFRILRSLGLFDGDPTLDLHLPARVPVSVRPLEEEELLQARFASQARLDDTRLPAAAALGEAGLGTGELPGARIVDTDLANGRVWVRGTSRTDARWAYLSRWGARQIQARIDHLRHQGLEDDAPLVYEGRRGGASAQAASCLALNEILELAGLAGEPGIKPNSFAATYARQVFDYTGDLGDAAASVGRRSLDATAALIGHEWRSKDADERETRLQAAAAAGQHGNQTASGIGSAGQRRSARGRRPKQLPTPIAPNRQPRTVSPMTNQRNKPGAS